MADDEQQTLLDILAFIDTSSLAFGTADDDDDALPLLPFADDADDADDADLQLDTQSEASSTAATGTNELDVGPQSQAQHKKVYVRRNPRKQIAQLKKQAELLHERLTLLRRRQSHATQRVLPYQPRLALTVTTDHTASREDSGDEEPAFHQWIDKALVEFERRMESEELNAYLKNSLARQLRVSKALASILRADDESTEIQHMYGSHPANRSDTHDQLFTQLYHYLEALYCNTGLIMDKLGTGSSSSVTDLSISSRSRVDPALGLTLEFTANTPVMCEFTAFEKLLWGRMQTSSITHECQHFEDKAKNRRQPPSNCVEKYLQLAFDAPHGQMTLTGSSAARRFASADRTVFVLSSRCRCSQSDIQLREDCWMIVSNVSSSTSSTSTTFDSPMTRVQQFYQVHVDQSSGQSASPEIRELQGFVLKSSGDRIQNHQRLLQQALMTEFGSNHHHQPRGGDQAASCQREFEKHSSCCPTAGRLTKLLRVLVTSFDEGEVLSFHQPNACCPKEEFSMAMQVSDDDQLLLDEVLSFIEASPHDLPLDYGVTGDDGDSDLAALPSLLLLLPLEAAEFIDSGATPSPTTSANDIHDRTQLPAVRKKKVYPRRDPRKEIAALQAEAQQLEDERSALLRRRQSAITRFSPYRNPQLTARTTVEGEAATRTPGSQAWMKRALEEIAKCEQSEQMNAFLKVTLAKHLRVSKALRSSIHSDDIDAAALENHLAAIDDGYQLFTQLYHYLEALYCNTGLIMDKLGTGSSSSVTDLSISSRSRVDPTLGFVLECSSSTELLCDSRTLGQLLWSRMITSTVTHECQRYEDRTKSRIQRSSDAIEKYVQLPLSGQFGQMTLSGTLVARKFTSADRTVIVLTTRSRCSELDVQLRADNWVIASNVNSISGSPMARVQSFNRVHVDQSNGHGASRELAEVLVKSTGDRTHRHQQLIQQTLMTEFGSDSQAASLESASRQPQFASL